MGLVMMSKDAIKAGDKVIYIKSNNKDVGDEEYKEYSREPGIVKRLSEDGKKAFVWYHTGCTAACTDLKHLEKGETRYHDLVHSGCHECSGWE